MDAKKLYNGKVAFYSSINGNMAEVLVKINQPGIYNLGQASCESIIVVKKGKVIVNGIELNAGQSVVIQKGERIDVKTDTYSEYEMKTDQYCSR